MAWAGLKIQAAGQGETNLTLSNWVLPEFDMRCGIIKKQVKATRSLAFPT
jgi:hypothetical protein